MNYDNLVNLIVEEIYKKLNEIENIASDKPRAITIFEKDNNRFDLLKNDFEIVAFDKSIRDCEIVIVSRLCMRGLSNLASGNSTSEEERFIREEVFCKEQGFVNEIDDLEDSSFHLLYYFNDLVIGVCRFYELEKDIYKIGRIAVLKEYRNKGIGREIVNSAISYIKELKAKKIYIYSQLHAVGFYEKLGFIVEGDIFYEEDHPHKKVYLDL